MFVFRPGLLEQAPHGFISLLSRAGRTAAARARLQAELVARVPRTSR